MAQIETKVPFGDKDVEFHEKPKLVQGVFSSVAEQYDLMNDLMSLGVQRLWKRFLISRLNPQPNVTLLDIAGGTGDISRRYVKAGGQKAIVADLTYDMMARGQDITLDHHISDNHIDWVNASAEDLPFDDNSFSLISIAFGLRNVTDRHRVLTEALRVLKPGGRFLCLEFSHPSLPLLAQLENSYNAKILPQLGQWIVKDRESYHYLAESIRRFPTQELLRHEFEQAGFRQISVRELSGGIVAIHEGVCI